MEQINQLLLLLLLYMIIVITCVRGFNPVSKLEMCGVIFILYYIIMD